jgi:molecular chaperone DnaK
VEWSLDLGTTNSLVARWDPTSGRPRVQRLVDICRRPDAEDPLEAPNAVPSAVHALPVEGFMDKMGRRTWLRKRVFWGSWGLIGRPAMEKNAGTIHPNYATGFKHWLGRDPLRTMARVGKETVSAREIARIFLRELLLSVKATTGERLKQLAVTVPVDAYESYRAELSAITRSLGVSELKFVDEPVAAAAGYGLGLSARRRVLVVDFGGGTLDLALVELDARSMEAGVCKVMAKAGRPVGGDVVDRWLLEDFLKQQDFQLPASGSERRTLGRGVLRGVPRRVKEGLYFKEQELFHTTPPEEYRAIRSLGRRDALEAYYDRRQLVDLLTGNGLYQAVEEAASEVLSHAGAHGIGEDNIDDVLMVGGSTLLPGVYPLFEERFGRDRVRAWQPFEAVVNGACAIAAGAYNQSDYIVHDYAIVVHDPETHERQHSVIIPRGTRFPTREDFWKRSVVPTCSLGEPERVFKLVISEIGTPPDERWGVGWDADGQVHQLKAGGDRLVVPLNEKDPTLGHLDPPHPPSDRAPRLELAFGVNADRWLCATVKDLKTSRILMKGEPVVRLL